MNDTPQQQGETAFAHAQPTSSCEYPIGSTRHREWVDGWMQRQAFARTQKTEAGE